MAERWLRWLLPLSLLLGVAGYFGPWVAHRAAGLVILGSDLAEYVKFLAEVRAGAIRLWREGFLLPAGALSMALTLCAANRRLGVSRLGAVVLLAGGLLAAFSLLPPAWTPALLLTPEFVKQTALLAACLLLVPASLGLRRLPLRLLVALCALPPAAAGVVAVVQFLSIRPAIARVYGAPPAIGFGFFLFVAAHAALLAVMLVVWLRRPFAKRHF
jgi:hypothetical protein